MNKRVTDTIILYYESGADAIDIAERFHLNLHETKKVIANYLKLEYNPSDDDGNETTDLYGNEWE